jgi:multidrug efflux pump subunit AcrA (membrane-fusion protein)
LTPNNRFKTVKGLEARPHYKILNRLITLVLAFYLISPWTQNISGKGAVTTLKPNQRPQSIQSVISGRIEKWYVKEGDFVKARHHPFISEIKEDYMDLT